MNRRQRRMLAHLEHRIKAIAASVVSFAGVYAYKAIAVGDPLTLRGLELAAALGVLSYLGVLKAPANGPRPR